jgi:pyruvate dehydrogenase E1 component alpha subunit
MHLFDRHVNFLGGHGIVGGHVPLATGVGFAIKYRGGDQCIVCYMGEAAVNNGAFHESLNMAGLWRLPVIYVIENNRYGMGTSVERASSIKDMFKRGHSYNIESAEVDGQDVWAVREATQEAIDRARKDYSPTLLEVRTYRYMGHSMSDAVSGTYRTKEELEEYRKRDPINLLKAKMQADKSLTDADLSAMEAEIAAVVQDSWDFADASPEPPLEALYEDVYVETTT